MSKSNFSEEFKRDAVRQITERGYLSSETWASSLGHIKAFGVEGTGSYGAGFPESCRLMAILLST